MKNKIKCIRPEAIVSNIIRSLLVLSIIVSFINRNYINLFTGVVTLFITFLPFFIARKNHINLPPSFQIIILLFIFAANYLGTLKLYYEKFWWWDIMLHTFSGVIFGFIGFLLVYIFNKEEKIDVYLSPAFMSLFALCFAVFIGTLWEIFEFSMDTLFGFNMQLGSLVDTMWDLIDDTVGGGVACLYGYAYVKYEKDGLFKKLITKFFKMNPRMFKSNTNDDQSNKISV